MPYYSINREHSGPTKYRKELQGTENSAKNYKVLQDTSTSGPTKYRKELQGTENSAKNYKVLQGTTRYF